MFLISSHNRVLLKERGYYRKGVIHGNTVLISIGLKQRFEADSEAVLRPFEVVLSYKSLLEWVLNIKLSSI